VPINLGSSDKARGENIAEEMKTKPRAQAVAIGYSEQRQAEKREGKKPKERREPERRK
jgi:hypothetical protein